MKNISLLIVAGILAGALLAQQKTPKVKPDPTDLIIEKSKQTMQQASEVSAKADKQVAASISQMRETIEVLEVEKEMLVEQVNVMQNEIVSIKSAPMQPFDVLAILPDSTGGGE